ncbi:MAG: VWA domain-containing protein [Planctomycetota bacterium]|jgi:Ca-activated chloride channel family protein
MNTLANPWLLLLALLVPLAYWIRRRRGAPAVTFAPAPFTRGLPRSWRVRILPLPVVLRIAGLLLAVWAIARPVHRVPVPHTTEGIDIMLCLDTSSSMTANDMDAQRTRLDIAKAAAGRFIEGRPDDRIGLITFARFPDVRCPPTLDHRALGKLLDGVGVVASDGPEDATGIGTAVARGAQLLGGSEARSRVVILLTDGEENIATADKPEEIAPLHAGQLSSDFNVRVYAIAAGLGRPDRGGQWIELDTGPVRRLAERTGGKFFEARDAGAIAGVYEEIDQLEKMRFAEPRYDVEEGFLPILVTAISLLVASVFLRTMLLAVMP